MKYLSFLHKIAGATQQQIDSVSKKLGLTPEQVVSLANAVDPTKEKKFEAWVIKQMGFQNIILPEDGNRVKQVLQDFITLSNKKQLQKRDIQQYKRIHDLEAEIDKIKGTEVSGETSSKLNEYLQLPGVSVAGQNREWLILKVIDPVSATKLASGTKWCTAGTRYAEHYIETNNNLYVIFKKTGTSLEKWAQITGDMSQFMNLKDHAIDQIDVTLYEVMAKVFGETPLLIKKCPEKIEAYLLKREIWEGHLKLNFPMKQLPELLQVSGMLTIKDNFRGDLSQIKFLETGGTCRIINPYITSLPESIVSKKSIEIEIDGQSLQKYPRHLEAAHDVSLKGMFKKIPETLIVGESLDLYGSRKITLPEDLTIKGYLNLTWSEIEELPKGLTIEGFLNLDHSFKLKKLPSDLKVGTNVYMSQSSVEEVTASFQGLHASFSELKHMADNLSFGELIIQGCNKLIKLPENLRVYSRFDAKDTIFSEVPKSTVIRTSGEVSFENNNNLVSLPDNIMCSKLILRGCKNLKTLPKGMVISSYLDLTDTGVTFLPEDLQIELAHGNIGGINPSTGIKYVNEYEEMKYKREKALYTSSLRKLKIR